MTWFLIALIPPALWSISNHLDKYLISKYIKGGGVGALMVFSSLIGLLLLPIIYVFHPNVFNIQPLTAALIALNAFLYILATLPYFYALQKDEASIVVPLFQFIPVISYIIAFVVLKETLLPKQIFGGILIMLGGVGISLDLSHGNKVKLKKEVLGLMLLSSLFYALNFTLFKYFAINQNFWVTSFWEYVGFFTFAMLLLIFVKPYRKEFLEVLKVNKSQVLALNGVNEIINIIAKLSFNFASLLAPVTMIWIVNGLQPLVVFVYGILLTLFFPHISKETIVKRHLAQKLVAILVMFLGTYFLN